VLFVQTHGNVKFKVRSGGRVFNSVEFSEGQEFVSSRYENLENKKFSIEVFSSSGKAEKFTLYVSASVLE
jgi:hypothetical protein